MDRWMDACKIATVSPQHWDWHCRCLQPIACGTHTNGGDTETLVTELIPCISILVIPGLSKMAPSAMMPSFAAVEEGRWPLAAIVSIVAATANARRPEWTRQDR